MLYNFLLCLLKLFSFLAAAASSLPLLIALGLIIGRRGHAGFVIQGGAKIAPLSQALAAAGFFYFPISYLSVTLPYGIKKSLLTGVFSPGGRPWLMASIFWLAGILALLFARSALKRLKAALKDDKYPFRFIKAAFLLYCLASLIFLTAFFMENWPFAGLPEGMSAENAAITIARHTVRRFFMSFSPAGAIGLLFAAHNFSHSQPPQFEFEKMAVLRWFSFWAAAGALPSLLITWGLYLPQRAARALPPGAPGFGLLISGIALQTLAVLLWVWIIARPSRGAWRIAASFILTLLAEFWPLLIRFL